MYKNTLSIQLKQMLNKYSTSYKILWFDAICKEIINGESEVTMKKLISRMVALAWYPIMYHKLNFGPQDNMKNIIFYAYDFLKIPREENEENIVDIIFNSNDKKLNKLLKNITNCVPYRLLSSLYNEKVKIRKNILGRNLNGSEFTNYIIELSNQDSQYFYRIDKTNRRILFNEMWIEYIKDNQAIIKDLINYEFVCYLQSKNTSIPAIPFKLYPPKKRDLSHARKYWRIIEKETAIKDIYTKNTFDKNNIKNYGAISIDHFIPWSFVLHDELWNLIPTFKNINSSKSDSLPNLDLYYDYFCNIQCEAFIIAKQSKKIKQKHLEDYYNLNSCLSLLNHNNENFKHIFIDSLRKTINPLYEIATNQGYNKWEYSY